ncbi:MAG TPA: hypothetical protein VN861_08695 [Candidatus Acidoferrales bacterium]|nr:hypothetical protein [Candidatus Acidoferrales bacterium]
MQPIARSCMAILLSALLGLPGFAANEKPLGMVIQAQSAQLASSKVAVGTTVYSGDKLETEVGGGMRLRMGTSQLYLLGSSSATVSQRSDAVLAVVARGTVGFSSNGTDQFELEVPEGVIRAAYGRPANGQVTIVGPQEIVISAYHGALVLDNDGEIHTIPEGKSYRVTMDLEPATAAPVTAASQDDANTTPAKRRRRKLAFFLIFGAAAALGSYGIWDVLSESSSTPKN